MTPQFADMTSSSIFFFFFWCYFVSLVTCSYWSKFHVNFINASGVMITFFHKGLTRNPKIGNSPTWVLPNIWRLGQFRDTKFGTDVSKEMLLNGANCQGYRFYRFWVIMGKTTGGEGKITPLCRTPRLGLRIKNTYKNSTQKLNY